MRSRPAAAGLVLAFAVCTGWLAWRSIVGPPPTPEYVITVNGPAFGAPEPQAKNLYLRRIIALPQRPRHAWMQVAARDRLRVYVNGELLAGGDRDGLAVAAVLDLTAALKPGLNVIAITARQSSIDHPPAIAVSGAYAIANEVAVPIGVETEWRASTKYEREWLSPVFHEPHWQTPPVVPVHYTAAVSLPLRAITVPSRASWISPAIEEAGHATVRRDFQLAARPSQAWLRVSANSPYRLAVNGVSIDRQEGALATGEPPYPKRRSYDITTFLHRGRNVVTLLLTRADATPRLMADLEVEDRTGARVAIGTDAQWISTTAVDNWLHSEVEAAVWQPCRVESGDAGFPPWTIAHEHVTTRPDLPATARRAAAVLALTLLLAVVAWASCEAARRRAGHAVYLALVPVILAVVVVYVGSYDTRFRAPTHPGWFLLALVSVPVQWLLVAWLRAPRLVTRPTLSRAGMPAVLFTILAMGFWLRLDGISVEPLQWDEVEHYEYTLGFFDRGFPSRQIHPDLPIAYVHTSELMFLPSAAAALFFDDPRYVMRFPAVVWSVLSILLVYLTGRRLFSPVSGLLAAGVLALAPAVVAMATVGRYFSQLQFFTLLAVYALWMTVRGSGPPDRKALAITALAFVSMYLTWEGSAFIAIGLALAALFHRRARLQTIFFDVAVWVALAGVGLVLLLQYSHTVLQQTQYLWYGTSLSDLRIRAMWDYPTFQPWFYIWASSWSPDALVPMAGLLAAILLSAHHPWRRPLRFLLVIYLTTCLFMATLLPAMAWRYIHHLVPVLVLLASAAVVAVTSAVTRLARRTDRGSIAPAYARGLAGLIALAFVGLSGGVSLDLRELETFRVDAFDMTRFKYANLEGPSEFVRAHLRPGDAILATDPFQVKHFMRLPAGRSAPFFWPASRLQLSATLDDVRPVALDRRDGTPAIADLETLRSLFTRYERVWYVVQPQRHENQNLPEISTFIRQHMDVVYEDFDAVVLLRDRTHRSAGLRYLEERGLGFGRKHRSNFPPEPQLPGS